MRNPSASDIIHASCDLEKGILPNSEAKPNIKLRPREVLIIVVALSIVAACVILSAVKHGY